MTGYSESKCSLGCRQDTTAYSKCRAPTLRTRPDHPRLEVLLSLEESFREKNNAVPLFPPLPWNSVLLRHLSAAERGAGRIPMFVSPVFQLLKIFESVLVGTVRDSSHTTLLLRQVGANVGIRCSRNSDCWPRKQQGLQPGWTRSPGLFSTHCLPTLTNCANSVTSTETYLKAHS